MVYDTLPSRIHVHRISSFSYPGGLRPDRRAPGDFAEEGAFQNIFLLRFVYVF